MARDYTSEYIARTQRAINAGFRSYNVQRSALERTKRLAASPAQRRQWIEELQAQREAAEAEEGPRPHGLQGPSGPSPDPEDWDYYWPTRTINAPRPRTNKARYSRKTGQLEVVFDRPSPASPDGTWTYFQVPYGEWIAFKRNASPGRYIDSTLNGHPNARGGWGDIQSK